MISSLDSQQVNNYNIDSDEKFSHLTAKKPYAKINSLISLKHLKSQKHEKLILYENPNKISL